MNIVQELFIAITSRRKEQGTLCVGVSLRMLLDAGMNHDDIENSLEQLKQHMEVIGLELVEYVYAGEKWFAARSNYSCPTELDEEEEATLAVIFEFLEKQSDPLESVVPVNDLKKRLVKSKYFTLHQLERILKHLEYLGYINRSRQGIFYAPRTLLEFSQDARKHIAHESEKLMF